ncbi:GNAT family N-acetyltransferase [Propionibacterium australiense]|uniref:GNAT family N-acetyltransferase n=1 Tax=Propionibacterium australiense TaxID=119981 RepID=UPI001C716C72|nr:GNAT family N-acetyltransferase [Propionibacterium australiense]
MATTEQGSDQRIETPVTTGKATMSITVEQLTDQDVEDARAVWNEVVAAGDAFPQTDQLGPEEAAGFFADQSLTGVARDTSSGRVLGVYILHPNNVGRCGHIANASYAVARASRGQGVGEQLVRHSMGTAARLGFRILQFNAVVSTNHSARALYERLGFVEIGQVPGGFRHDSGDYADITLYYADLTRC